MTDQTGITQEDIAAVTDGQISAQQIASILAAGIDQAYTPTGSGGQPVLKGYSSVTSIYVALDFGLDAATGGRTGPPTPRFTVVEPGESLDAVDASLFSLFGFTAVSADRTNNILVLRGTATAQEAFDDLYGFAEALTPCQLPTARQSRPYGNVNKAYWKFYSAGPVGTHWDSLANSCAKAIRAAEKANPNTHSWFVGGHSLGGAMVALAMLDAQVDGTIFSAGTTRKIVMTFGSAYTGDQTFVASFARNVLWLRIANLCDFVPSFNAPTPPKSPPPYVHVGWPVTFTWQWWDDWKNHSLTNTYQVVVNNHWDVLTWLPKTYPT